MTIIFSKHIHSTFAGASSNDKWGDLVIKSKELDFPLKEIKEGDYILSKKFPMLNGETVSQVSGDRYVKIIYFESDKTFYYKKLHSGRGLLGDGYEKTKEFADLIESYKNKGWNFKERGERMPEQDAYWERVRVKNENKMKKDGLVLWKRIESMVPSDYQGGFSDSVFNSEKLKEYVGYGYPCGWIGHTVRHPEHDKLIEEGLRERGLSDSAMYNWISSTDGRHFGNSLEGFTLPEQLEKIKKYLNSMFNLCLVFGSSRHEGNLKSTETIREDYQAQGILLPEDNSDYDRNKVFMMLSNIFLSDKVLKGIATEEEIMVNKEIIKKIKGEK